MLTNSTMVAFVLTRNYDQARAFYEDKLGFEFISQDNFALLVRAGANPIRIVRMPDFTPARNTVLGWEVADIEASVAWLKARGIVLEDYPFIQDHKLGIWSAPGGDRVAWFKDPDGNVLSVSQHSQA
jgi:catechol 2,3-dioxygenase-like lactoylglutathione lyase family enzyme